MKRAPVLAVGIAVAVVAAVIALLPALRDEPSPQPPEPDLARHPVYAQYQFRRDERVVNIGSQPLFVPTGLISAAMARDAVLREALDALGWEVRFHPFLKGPDVNFFLASGQLDAGIAGDMPTLTAVADLDVAVTSLMALGFTSVVTTDLVMLDELRGGSIAYAEGSSSHYTLLSVLATEGLTADDVQLVAMEADAMPAALHDGTVDAFAAWEPFVSLGLALDPEHSVIRRRMSSGYLYFSRSFLREEPEVVREIVASQARAMRWLRTSVANLLRASEWTLGDSRQLSDVVADISSAQLVDMATDDLLGLDASLVVPAALVAAGSRLQQEYEFLERLGKIRSTAGWERMRRNFDPAIAIEVMERAASYRLGEFRYDARPYGSP